MISAPVSPIEVQPIAGAEAIQYYDCESKDIIWQRGNKFSFRIGDFSGQFKVPLVPKLKPFNLARIGRRLARIDKGVCLPISTTHQLFVFYQGNSYRYDLPTNHLEKTGQFEFRNPLHGGTSIASDGRIYFGEYFFNSAAREVKVFASDDNGSSFHVAHTFPANSIWHIHGVIIDPFDSERIWIHTGDFDGQCKLLMTNDNFRSVTECGGSDQYWRAASLLFTSDSLIWGMDSPEQQAHIVRFDRKSGQINIGQKMPGPIWFSKNFTDGSAVIQTSVEWYGRMAGSTSNYAKIFATEDYDKWHEVGQFKKDFLHPKLFRHGVIHFSKGNQTSQDFTIHGDALSGFDGRSVFAKINRLRKPQ